jgi:hypothetical protein
LSTRACSRPSSPIVAITRTIAAALRNARSTIAWNANDTRPPAITATTHAGHTDHECLSCRSANAM